MRRVFAAPERGDVILIIAPRGNRRANPGHRPLLILSPQAYNERTGLALACPISSLNKGYPFEVPIPSGLPISGVALADQAFSLDWRASRAERICSLPSGVIEECLGKLLALLG